MSDYTPPDPFREDAKDPVLIREAVVRYRGPRRRLPGIIRGAPDVVRFLRTVVRDDAREHFIVLMLNGRHRPIAYQVVSVGTATASLVHPREVYQPAVAVGAVAVLVAHSHPSGEPAPSREDRDITDRLLQAGHVLGIPLLDSIVIAGGLYHSAREAEPEKFTATPQEEPR